MLTLYDNPFSPFARKVRMVLRFKGSREQGTGEQGTRIALETKAIPDSCNQHRENRPKHLGLSRNEMD